MSLKDAYARHLADLAKALDDPEGLTSFSYDSPLSGEFNMRWAPGDDETPKTARLTRRGVVQQQKRLRQVKSTIRADMKHLREAARATKANVQPGFLASLAGRGSAKSDVADKKRRIDADLRGSLEPFEWLMAFVDRTVTNMDDVKLEIDRWIEAQR